MAIINGGILLTLQIKTSGEFRLPGNIELGCAYPPATQTQRRAYPANGRHMKLTLQHASQSLGNSEKSYPAMDGAPGYLAGALTRR